MLVELVQTTTSDGVRLDGSLQMPAAPGETRLLAVDAALCLHGAGSHFYGSTVFPLIAPTLVDLGLAVLRVNTRGHDMVSTAGTTTGPRRLGGAYELVDDCRHDIAGWLSFLAARGLNRVLLVGHSLGAVKSVYALANGIEGDLGDAVVGLLALSPPRLSYRYFREGPRGAEFFSIYRTAEEHITNGRGDTLMEVNIPLPYLITANGYVDKYGPAERYNFVPLVERVTTPALFTFGELELERNPAFFGLAEAVAAAPSGGASRQVATIAGANHFYAGVGEALCAAVSEWTRATFER